MLISYYFYLALALMLAATAARARAVLRARADDSGSYMDVAEREMIPFNSPLQLVRELAFFGSVARRQGPIGKLALLFVAGTYTALGALVIFMALLAAGY